MAQVLLHPRQHFKTDGIFIRFVRKLPKEKNAKNRLHLTLVEIYLAIMFKNVVSVIRKSIPLDNFFKTFVVKEVKVICRTFIL